MKNKILIVESAADLAIDIGSFKRINYEVVPVTNSLDAIKMLSSQEDISHVLIGFNLQGLTGPDLVQKIRETNKTVHICLVSVASDESMLQAALSSGANSTLRRPFSASVLLAALKSREDRETENRARKPKL